MWDLQGKVLCLVAMSLIIPYFPICFLGNHCVMTCKITQINIKYVLIYFGIQQQRERWKNKERIVSSHLWVIDIKVPYKYVEVPRKWKPSSYHEKSWHFMIQQKCQILDFNGSDNGWDSNKMSILIFDIFMRWQIVTYGPANYIWRRITIDISR